MTFMKSSNLKPIENIIRHKAKKSVKGDSKGGGPNAISFIPDNT